MDRYWDSVTPVDEQDMPHLSVGCMSCPRPTRRRRQALPGWTRRPPLPRGGKRALILPSRVCRENIPHPKPRVGCGNPHAPLLRPNRALALIALRGSSQNSKLIRLMVLDMPPVTNTLPSGMPRPRQTNGRSVHIWAVYTAQEAFSITGLVVVARACTSGAPAAAVPDATAASMVAGSGVSQSPASVTLL